MIGYPIWEPFISDGLLIAVVAILHVFVSHFAIGGGLYLVLAEITARRNNDEGHLAYVRRHSKFFVLLTLVFGAVTGVGIWVTIGLISPLATKWLINNYVWGWATEWVFFFVEITAALLYFYGWQRLKPKTHVAIGWIYFFAAWLSLVVINGILTFMLTPGGWLQSGSFWAGFFNPTYFPSLVFRTFICLVLAGLYATLTVAREKDTALKIRIMRFNGLLVVGGLVLAAASGFWYYSALPDTVAAALVPGSTPEIALQLCIFSAIALLVLSLLATLVFPRRSGYVSAGILLLVGLISLGSFEWTRESLRKPYLIYDFLYANSHLKDGSHGDEQYITPLTFATGDRGRDLYLHNCRSCHTIKGYNGLSSRLSGFDKQYIANILPRLDYFITGKMPPFSGDEADAEALAGYLKSQAAPDPLQHDPNMPQKQKQAIVFRRRCGGCHTMTGMRPIATTFEGIAAGDASDIIDVLPDLADGMPPFTGDADERQLLIEYLTGAGQ